MCARGAPLTVWQKKNWGGPHRREAEEADSCLDKRGCGSGLGLSSGDGGKAANCRTCSSSLQWVREKGVGGDALVCSLGT